MALPFVSSVYREIIENCTHAINLFMENDNRKEAAVAYAERGQAYQQTPKWELATADFNTADKLFNKDSALRGVPFCGSLLHKFLVINPLDADD